jgi:branched-chain amino acid transport system substrate-binding protein
MRCSVRTFVVCAVMLVQSVHSSLAQEKIRIGVILTLSGPLAALGQQAQRGMNLALTDLNKRIAGREVELLVNDDELKPDLAVSKARALVERDKVDFVVGALASNIMQAIHRPVIETGTILISPNAGPSTFAGKSCHPNFFVTSYQNDQVHEVMGKVAQNRGYKRVYVLVPNCQPARMQSRASSVIFGAKSWKSPMSP